MNEAISAEQRQFIDASLSNAAIVEWMAQFSMVNAESFLATFWKERTGWLQFGERYRKDTQYWLTADLRQAEEVLFYIQQKKLFDLQCLWRSEQAEVPGIEHSAQFVDLEPKIRSLDIIPPITSAEIELLKDWVTDRKWSRTTHTYHGWQDYRAFVKDNCEDPVFGIPTFYKFVDARTKTPSLWKVLPDKRGEKEIKYMRAASQARYAKSEPVQLPEEFFDPRPRLWEHGDSFDQFSERFEGHQVNECRVAYAKNDFLSVDHELNHAIETLKNAEGKAPMEANSNWREAILYSAWKYERDRLVKAIDVAYENYCFNRQMGIAYSDYEGDPYFDRTEFNATEILDGREILGEPRDFNF